MFGGTVVQFVLSLANAENPVPLPLKTAGLSYNAFVLNFA